MLRSANTSRDFRHPPWYEYDVCVLLWSYAAYSGNTVRTLGNNLSVQYSRVKYSEKSLTLESWTNRFCRKVLDPWNLDRLIVPKSPWPLNLGTMDFAEKSLTLESWNDGFCRKVHDPWNLDRLIVPKSPWPLNLRTMDCPEKSLTLESWTDGLSRKVLDPWILDWWTVPKRRYRISTLGYVRSQKSAQFSE